MSYHGDSGGYGGGGYSGGGYSEGSYGGGGGYSGGGYGGGGYSGEGGGGGRAGGGGGYGGGGGGRGYGGGRGGGRGYGGGRGGGNKRPGDWDCPGCGNNCFASRNECNRCQTPKPAGGGGGGGGYGDRGGGGGGYGDRGGGGGGGPRGGGRDGDWACPNCSNNCFAFRTECNRCQTPKPGGGAADGGYGGGYGNSGSAGGSGNGSSGGYGGGGGGGGGGREGDWACPNCNNNCFSFRTECNRCQTPKPAGGAGGAAPIPYASGGGYGGGGGGGGRGSGGGYGGRNSREDRSPPRRKDRSRSRSRDRAPRDRSTGGVRNGHGDDGGGDAFYQDNAPPPAGESACGKNCGDECDNNRIYVSGLPSTITGKDLVDKFGTIGIIARVRQKRGYKDQWPFSVRIYTDEANVPKGDCIIKYEEATSAHAALRWFDGIDFKGGKIGVVMAAKPSLNNRY